MGCSEDLLDGINDQVGLIELNMVTALVSDDQFASWRERGQFRL
jgi:hypothetical protein